MFGVYLLTALISRAYLLLLLLAGNICGWREREMVGGWVWWLIRGGSSASRCDSRPQEPGIYLYNIAPRVRC